MRSLYLILPASLLVIASGAGAQTQNQPTTQPDDTSTVQVTGAAQPFEFQLSDAEWIGGAYAMANGWRLKVDPSDNGIVAQIDKRAPTLMLDPSQGIDSVAQISGRPVKLVAVSRDRYVSSDGNMALEFNRGDEGDGMLMSYVPDTSTAQVVVVSSTGRLAQR